MAKFHLSEVEDNVEVDVEGSAKELFSIIISAMDANRTIANIIIASAEGFREYQEQKAWEQ
jgi:hypothetical protein